MILNRLYFMNYDIFEYLLQQYLRKVTISRVHNRMTADIFLKNYGR